jgi:geranylgeranyl reductase family protein
MRYDIAIIGAGPAGATCALALRDAGLRVALIDQAQFPRDKVCGDAIPARCGKVLQQLDPRFAAALRQFPQAVEIASCHVVAPNGGAFDYQFKTRGWCSPRQDFDAFLLDLVRAHSDTDILQGLRIQQLSRQAGDWVLSGPPGQVKARLLVGADGANGITARQLTQQDIHRDHHCAAVRGYYHGIAGLQPDRMEIHLPQGYLPGYLWIFPVGDGRANVGYGMLSSEVARRKIVLRQALPDMLAKVPGLAERFAQAKLEGPIQGFGLPLGARRLPLSGAGFVLCGDAAALIEPATGEGIGNAMLSGQLAAEVLIRACAQGRTDAAFLADYDARVYGRLWQDLRNKHLAQRLIANRPGLLNFLVGAARRPGPIRFLMRKVF